MRPRDRRTSLMIEVGSYCCSLVESPLPSSNTNPGCAAALRFFGFGIGVMNLALRRCSIIFCVGCPVSSSSQCLFGYSYGEFIIGWSKKGLDIVETLTRRGKPTRQNSSKPFHPCRGATGLARAFPNSSGVWLLQPPASSTSTISRSSLDSWPGCFLQNTSARLR